MRTAKTRCSVDLTQFKALKNKHNINHNHNNNKLKETALSTQKTIQLKKLREFLSIDDKKILEIKGKKKLSTFHLIDESDKYKQIQKNLQNTILDLSIKMIKDFKFDPGLTEIRHRPFKKKHKSKKDTKINDNKNFGGSPKNKIRPSLKISRHSQKMTQIKQIANEINRKIKRIHNLYDSFGEDESDKDKEQGNYGLNPRSIFMDIYDIFLFFSSGFCLVYLPYRLAKTKLVFNSDEHFVFYLIYFSEIIYIIDVIFGFFRWFYNNEFKLISSMRSITLNYLSGNFVIDLIMAIPFYSILRLKDTEKYEYNIAFNEKNFLLKILVCFKAFKIFKIFRIKNNRVTYFFNKKLAKNYFLERLNQILNFVIMIFLMFNLIICCHIYVGELSYPNWIVSYNLQDKSFIEIYLASFYFIIATMTSVGYGDIVCKSSFERYFQIIILSIGLVAYSWIISAVGDYVKNKSRAMDNFNRDMTKLEEIRVAYPNMPFKLYTKIQQHIQRMLTQNKKFEYNILVNSLPYYLQNSVLFQIHQNEIEHFRFFKDCDNSDFILKVLTHFIPIFSKKNIVLVGEGEFYENIFFVKEGRLALEAIIDLDDMEMSIEKYLKYRFEEIEQIEDFSDHEDSKHKGTIKDDDKTDSKPKGRKGRIRTRNLIGMISKQFENIDDISVSGDSNIDQEIGKCDFNTETQELYKGNIEYIHILDLLKNEYFGEILMFLNIPNPLSLKVKSKRVDLYILRKKDAFNIRKDYQNIWQRINKKSIHNIKSLKSLTLGVITRYCEMNGIIVRNNQIVKSSFRSSLTKYKNTNTHFVPKGKSKFFSKFDLKKNKRSSLTALNPSIKMKNTKEDSKNKKKSKIKSKGRESTKLKELHLNDEDKKEIKRANKTVHSDKGRKGKAIYESSDTSNSSFYPNNLSQKNTIQKTIKESTEKDKNNFIKKNNDFNNCISKESVISFKIKSSYENINKISKGKYIENSKFQDLIKKIIKNCIRTDNSNQKESKYSDKFSFIERKIRLFKFNSDFIKISEQGQIYSNSLYKNNINSNSYLENKSSLDNISIINMKNKLKSSNLNEIIENKSLKSFSNLQLNKEILSQSNNIDASNEQLKENNNSKNEAVLTFRNTKEIEQNSKKNLEIKKEKAVENIYSNNIIKNEAGNNIGEVNLNYVNNFCGIY